MRATPTRPGASGPTIAVLGPTLLRPAAGTPAGPSGSLTMAERRILAQLVLVEDAGATVAELEDAVWDDEPPRMARQSLHNHIHRLRAKLQRPQLVRDADRYRLHPRPATDITAYEGLVAAAEVAGRTAALATAAELLREALTLWRGEPYADLPATHRVVVARTRLENLRVVAENQYVDALLATGRTTAAISELQLLVAATPGHERRWELLLDALRRAGRRTEGLEAFRAARRALVDELGIEPGQRLQKVHRLLLHGATTAPAPTHGLGPVGRDAVIAELVERLRAGARVNLHGEAGIGKSAVLRGVATAWGGEVIEVRCGEHLLSALGPVAALMAGLAPRLTAAGLPTSPAEIDRRVGGAGVGQQSTPGTLLRQAAGVIVAGLATDPAPLLVLDDADRCGPTTRAVLGEVIGASTAPVLMGARGQLAGFCDWVGEDVVLSGLTLEGTTELASRVLEVRVPDEFGGWLRHLTGGHPLFSIACLRDLLGRDVVAAGIEPRPPLTVAVPTDVTEALQRRIDALPEEVRRVVDTVAVVGQPILPVALAALVAVEDMDQGVRDGVVVADAAGRISLVHDLLRRVAYEAIPRGRRTELHHAAASLDLSPAYRATHLLAAIELDPTAAIHAAADAAADAVGTHAYAEAAEWFDHAVAAGVHEVDDLERLRWRIEAADARRLAGIDGHAERLLDAAEESMGCGSEELRRRAVLASLQLGGAVEAGADQQRAAALVEQALRAEHEPGWWSRIAAAASLVHSIAGEPDRCRELFTAAWARAPDDDAVIADVLPFAYMALAHPDDLAERERAAARLASAADHTGSGAATWEAGHLAFSAALQRGDGTAARVAHQRMVALGDRVADAGRRWSMAYQEAALAAIDGRLEAAEAHAAAALEIGSGLAPSRAFGAYAGQVFELRRRQGRLEELAGTILQLVADQPEVPGWAAAGALVLATTDPARSRALFDQVLAEGGAGGVSLPRDFAWLGSVMSLGRAAVVLGDVQRAARVRPVLTPYADRVCWEGTCTWGPVAGVLADLAAVLGDEESARGLEARAAVLERRLGADAT